MKKRTRWIAALLAAALVLGLAGCQLPHPEALLRILQGSDEKEATELGCDVTWRSVFRDTKFPAGGMRNDEVAFARRENGEFQVENVSRETMETYDDGGYLPRYSIFRDQYDPMLELLIRCISYACSHGCQRFVLPMDEDFLHALREADRYFWWSVDVECITNESTSVKLEDGSTLYYYLCVIDTETVSDEYVEQQKAALETARQIVDEMPSDAVSDYDKALYLYRYLTDTVYYAYDEDFPEGEDYYTYALNLYYDTLIENYTVCAGYGKTFAWLCEMAGLTAFPVSGQFGETESHLWTMVQIDGGYYWFDPTWDEGLLQENYEYFGISDAQMEERDGTRHLYQAYEELLPACPDSLPQPGREENPVEALCFERGTVTDFTYRNDSLGLACTLSMRWCFLDDLDLGQGSGEAETPMEELFAAAYGVYDMAAYTDRGEEVDVYVQYIFRSERELSDEELAGLYLEQWLLDPDTLDGELYQQEFCGRSCWGIALRQTYYGQTFYQHCVLYRVGSFCVMAAATSYQESLAEKALDCFYAPEAEEAPTEATESEAAPAA